MADRPASIMVLGSSYGLLPGIKLSCAGHAVTFVGRKEEVDAMAERPLRVHLPMRRSGDMVTLHAHPGAEAAAGVPTFRTPETADVARADLVILAMQESQFAAPELIDMMKRIGSAGRPCLSIMNLPPPSFLARLGSIPATALSDVYASRPAWEALQSVPLTVASPDPQALRLDPHDPGSLTVTLASNFKVAPFTDDAAQRLLQRLAHDVSHLKADGAGAMRLPVAMVAHRSNFVPLAKWPMLITGNCRCVLPDRIRTIAEAVFDDLAESRAIYEDVLGLVRDLGASSSELVNFDDYARAAAGLVRPSSLARALASGAKAVERIDRLVINLFTHAGRNTGLVSPIKERIEAQLTFNQANP